MLKQEVKLFAAILSISASLYAGASHAATTVTGLAVATVVEALTVTNQQPLNFGHITPTAGGGSVTVNPHNARTVNGGVQVSGSYGRAVFTVQGAPGRTYSIHTPTSQVFTTSAAGGPGQVNSLTVNNFVTLSVGMNAAGVFGRLNGSGTDTLYLGGTLIVPANAVPGVYSGLVPVTVSY